VVSEAAALYREESPDSTGQEAAERQAGVTLRKGHREKTACPDKP